MKEAVGLFKNMDQLQFAIKELERTEFPRDSLSVLAHHVSIGKDFDSMALKIYENDAISDREAPVHSEEKTIGAGLLISGTVYLGAMAAALAAGAVAIPSIIAAAVVGGVGAGTAGAVLASLMGDHFSKEIEQQIEGGGILLWVRTPDAEKEQLASKILMDCGADNVKIQEH